MMADGLSRRRVLIGGAAAGVLAAMGLPEWILPALAQGEALVPFTDVPANFNTNPSELVRVLDIRRIDGAITPRDQFFTLQHYGQPDVDAASYRLSTDQIIRLNQDGIQIAQKIHVRWSSFQRSPQ